MNVQVGVKVDLNQEAMIVENDPGGMLKALWELPEQCLEAQQIANQVQINLDGGKLSNVVVTGLGGSAIGGDLLRVYVGDKSKIPVAVNRDYTLPNFIGPKTLIFAVSYSGNTEETLSAYEQAKKQGAQIVALTTGGKLGELAEKDGYPVVKVPGGISPRAATGYLLLPTIIILSKIGLIPDVSEEIGDMVGNLRTLREKMAPAIPVEQNLAKQLALRFENRLPVIWGASGTTEVIAQRWKGQINENAKAPAYWNIFPELNHNEIVGFEKPEDILQKLEIVILRDKEDHPRVQKRMEISKTIIKDIVSGISEIHSTGNSTLSRVFSLTYTGDYVSVYLAALYGVDPTPVKMIDFLKKKLAEA